MVLDGTESELIEACRRGESEGFRALFELHKDRVYSIALHFANDESAALDIAQDTFPEAVFVDTHFSRRGQF
jgi:DNA-directed RNA polymerase specialized sigma24 family protein